MFHGLFLLSLVLLGRRHWRLSLVCWSSVCTTPALHRLSIRRNVGHCWWCISDGRKTVLIPWLLSLRAGYWWCCSLRYHSRRVTSWRLGCWPHREHVAIGSRWTYRTAQSQALTSWDWRWCSRILETLPFILWKSWTSRRAHDLPISSWARPLLWVALRRQRLWTVPWLCIVEFVVGPVVAAVVVVLIEEGDHVDDGLRILLLLLFGDAVRLQCSLPFFG